MLKQKSSEYRGYRNAGIRLSRRACCRSSRNSTARARSAMLPAVHAFDKAHTVMLVEEGLLDAAAGAAILRGLRQLESEGVVETRARVGGGLHSGEQYLIRLLGEDIGGRFHLARSSGDLSSVAINTLQREKLLALMRAVNRLRRVLIDLARDHTDTILPGYSFGQHAQPMTLAHLWLSWAANARARLRAPARRLSTRQREPRRRGDHGRLELPGESRAHRRAARLRLRSTRTAPTRSSSSTPTTASTCPR